MYEMMDKHFVGLIVSVFNETKTILRNNVEIVCFQAQKDAYHAHGFVQIPMKITVNDDAKLVENNLQNLYQIPKILMQEENNSFQMSTQNMNQLCTMSNFGSNNIIIF
jgi:hypothetical protein